MFAVMWGILGFVVMGEIEPCSPASYSCGVAADDKYPFGVFIDDFALGHLVVLPIVECNQAVADL